MTVHYWRSYTERGTLAVYAGRTYEEALELAHEYSIRSDEATIVSITREAAGTETKFWLRDGFKMMRDNVVISSRITLYGVSMWVTDHLSDLEIIVERHSDTVLPFGGTSFSYYHTMDAIRHTEGEFNIRLTPWKERQDRSLPFGITFANEEDAMAWDMMT